MCNVLARFCLPFKKTNPTTTHNGEFNGIIQNSSEKENKYKITPVLCIKYDPSSVKEKIGEGGSSVVFHYNTGKTSYACKKIKTSISNVRNEINIMKTYSAHKHLPIYYDSLLNQDDKLSKYFQYSYIFMEYCKGVELFTLLKSNFCHDVATKIVYQLLTAISHLQKFNIIHGDIKLENIIIDYKNDIKLIDFGISKQLDGGKAISLKNHSGTIGYLSPEWLLFNYATLKTDIWSVGILYFILLNNSHVFNTVNLDAYKSQLQELDNLDLPDTLKIYNKTVPPNKYKLIYMFLYNTICYDKERYSVKRCLRSKIFAYYNNIMV
jgi:non-specific serine/threonine protein kinase